MQDEEEARSGNLIGYGRPLFAGLSVASVGLLIVSSWPNGGGSMCAAYLASALLIPIVALSVWTAVKPDWLTAHLKGPRERVSIDLADIGDRVRQARSGRTTARVGTGNA